VLHFPIILRTVEISFFLATVAGYLMELIVLSKLDLKMGLVQTAYANGSSTKYIMETLVRTIFKTIA
jgi:hypothetical protein